MQDALEAVIQSAQQHDAATVIAKSVHDARNKAITKGLRAYKWLQKDKRERAAAQTFLTRSVLYSSAER